MREDLFTLPEFGEGSEEQLLKALSAGYETDAAQFQGGRTLIPEDCETTMVNAMREQREDCKLMNSIKKTSVKSTVHQYNRRTSTGNFDIGFVEEGGIAVEDNQELERVTRNVKYIQKYREVTEQMNVVETFENAFESEKLAGTLDILKIAERHCFHGDSAVVPKQFDGLIAQIKKTPLALRNVNDLRGKTIQTAGERIFTDTAMQISDHGGEANKVFYPLILGQDIQDLCKDRLRYTTDDNRMAAVFKDYPTLYGTLSIADEAGPDKLFRPKNVIKPGGDAQRAPNAPATVTAVAADNDASQFVTADAGNYLYKVFAVNEYGISPGTSPTAAVAIAAGKGISLTITPDATKPGTGFIICRSSKNGADATIMEMVRIGKDTQNATTVYVDLNDDLPGTAEMLFITEKKLQTVVEFYQLLPLRLYRMYPTNRLVTPFILALWGTPDLKTPEWCGLVKNIQYNGGQVY